MVSSQHRATRSDVSFQTKWSECLVIVELTPHMYIRLRETLFCRLVIVELTPHMYIRLRETLFCPSSLFAVHRPGHAESWIGLYRSAVSVKSRTKPTSVILCIHTAGCMHTGTWQSSTLFWLQQEKVDLRLRIVTVPEVWQEVWRNGVETEKNRNKCSNCDIYVTCVDVRCFL